MVNNKTLSEVDIAGQLLINDTYTKFRIIYINMHGSEMQYILFQH